MENGEKRIAVLIDADNVSADYIRFIFDEVSNHGAPTYKRIYGDFTQPRLGKWKSVLLDYSIVPIQQYSYTYGKNSTDSALIIDAMDILYSHSIDGFCIVSSDSDFTRLASRLREAGMTVIGMGERKTPTPFVNACEQFKYLEMLVESNKGDDPAEDTEATVKSAVSPSRPSLSKAITAIIDDVADADGWASLGSVGQRLNTRYPAFDSRNYGFKKLSHLVDSFKRFEVQSRTMPNQHEAQTFIRYTENKPGKGKFGDGEGKHGKKSKKFRGDGYEAEGGKKKNGKKKKFRQEEEMAALLPEETAVAEHAELPAVLPAPEEPEPRGRGFMTVDEAIAMFARPSRPEPFQAPEEGQTPAAAGSGETSPEHLQEGPAAAESSAAPEHPVQSSEQLSLPVAETVVLTDLLPPRLAPEPTTQTPADAAETESAAPPAEAAEQSLSVQSSDVQEQTAAPHAEAAASAEAESHEVPAAAVEASGSPDAASAQDTAETAAEAETETPKKRTRRSAKATESAEPEAVQEGTGEPDTPAKQTRRTAKVQDSEASEGEASEEAAPKKRSRRSAKTQETAETEPPAAEGTEEAPKKRTRRASKAKEAAEAEAAAADTVETETPKKRTRRSAKTAETSDGAVAAADAAETEAPKKRTRRSTKATETAETEQAAADAAEIEKPKRRTRKAAAAQADSGETPEAEAPKRTRRTAKKAEATAAAEPKKRTARKAAAAADAEPADGDSPAPKTRRRRTAAAETPAESAPAPEEAAASAAQTESGSESAASAENVPAAMAADLVPAL